MEKKKTLLIAGWGRMDYLVAAAAAYKALKGRAEIAFASRRSLAEVLAGCGSAYGTIYVLGVGLAQNLRQIVETLGTLKKEKVEVVWVSVFDLPAEYLAEARLAGEASESGGFARTVVRSETLVDAVAAEFTDLPANEVKTFRQYTEPPGDGESVISRYWELMDVAGFFHRTQKNDDIYKTAIRQLAIFKEPERWPDELKTAIERYRAGGRYEIQGKSRALEKIREVIQQVGPHDRARVLVLGASGTGKEAVAQQIHLNSSRWGKPLIAFNCASVTPDLLEDRFFGHEKGAFTHANAQVKGLFERANGSTLFLDEVGEMPMGAQTMLLRTLETGKILRVGGTEEVPVDVRLVVATNRNLQQMVREKKFRLDLYQRLAMVVIKVPPLAERLEDIDDIAYSWWFAHKKERLDERQKAALKSYDYPGNVRELINLLERAIALGERDFAKLIREHRELNKDLFADETSADDIAVAAEDAVENLDEVIRRHCWHVLAKHAGNKTRAAAALGISVNTLKKHLREG